MAMLFFAAALAALSGCGEEKPEKESWYWMDRCFQDHIPFRSWKESGKWKYEIVDNIDEDILLTYLVRHGGKVDEEEAAIKTGEGTGEIATSIPESEEMVLEVVSVIAMKRGIPYKVIECHLE